MNGKNWIFLIIIILFSSSCKKAGLAEEATIDPIGEKYLHIAHTRNKVHPFVVSEIENIDYSKYSLLMLGGDLTEGRSSDDETMQYLDDIFDLGNETTLWTLGNHDYHHTDRIHQFTNRPNYYSYYKNNICFIVLDTQDSLCHISGSQKEFFNNVIDTIQSSSYLMVLHHKLVWMLGNSDLESAIPYVSNGQVCNGPYCLFPNNFYQDIYPKLLEVQSKGIQTFCIGGDIGIRAKQFEYTTESGIVFLASGIYYKYEGNKGLVFYHDTLNQTICYKFISIEYL